MIDHPTTKVGEDENLQTVDAAVVYHEDEDRYELVGLEYDGTVLPARHATKLYEADRQIIYEDEMAENGYDSGEITWSQVKTKLER